MSFKTSGPTAPRIPPPVRKPGLRAAIDDTGRNLAQWLREVAHGPASVPPALPVEETSDSVLQHLENRVGRKLRSRAAIDGFLKDLAVAESREWQRGMRRGILRGALLLCLLLGAILHFYYWSVALEIESLPSVQVYGVPRPAPNGQGPATK